MRDAEKTKEELLKESDQLRLKVAELEKSIQLKTNDALIESESRLSSIYDTVADVIFYLEVKSKGVYQFNSVNKSFCKATGLSEDMIVGKLVNEVIPEPTLTMVLKKYKQAINKKSIVSWEETSDYPVGRLTGDVSIAPIFDTNGRCTHLVGSVHDITIRKKADEELKSSEERLKILFEFAPDAYYLSDLSGIFIDGNKAAEKLMGFKKEEIIGKSFLKLKLLSVKELFKASKLLLKNVQGKGTGPDQFTLNCKNGSQIQVEISTYPVKIKGKTVVLGIARDITERKKAEQLLKDSEYLLRKSQKIAVLGSYILDITNGIWNSSPVLDDIFGINKKYIKNIDTWVKFVHTDDRDMMRDYFATNVLTNHETFDKVYRIKRINDKQVRWVHGLGELEFDDDGNPIKMMGTIQDITKRKQLEEAQHQYEHIVSSSTDMLAFMDNNYTYLTVNVAYLEAFGLTSEQLIGKTVTDVFGKEFFKTVIKPKADLCLSGKVVNYQDWFDFSATGRCYMDINYYPYYSDGNKIMGFVVNGRNITGRKQLENEMLDQRNKLDRILEGTNAGTWDWNIPSGKCVFNDRWAEIMGKTLKELEPNDINTWINNVHPDDLPKANEMLNKVFNKELDYFDVVFRQPHKNGSWIWVNARGKVVEWLADGKPLQMSGTHLDITKQMQAQEELRKHRDHLEQLVKERTAEVDEKNKKLSDQMKVFVGRELTIRNLENRIKALGGK